MPDDDPWVWVRGNARKKKKDTYHTDRDCRHVKRIVGEPMRKRLSTLPDHMTECRFCSGEAIQTGGPAEHYRALLRHAESLNTMTDEGHQ